MKQNKYTKAARGQPCTLKLDKCESGGDNLTTIFAHKNGGPMGSKMTDDLGRDIGFFSCHYCHAVYDRQINHPWYKPHFVDEMVEFAIRSTDKKLIKMGVKP